MARNLLVLMGAIKDGTCDDYRNYLSDSDIIELLSWYNEFSITQVNSIDKIIELFSYLYKHEDIDILKGVDYFRVVDQLADIFGFEKDKFQDIYKGFRTMVFEI